MLADPTGIGDFDAITGPLSQDLALICTALKVRIIAAAPQVTEIVWPRQAIASYGVGPKKMSQHYLYIAPQKGHVNLGFYRGALLDDPGALLIGTGKAMRHVKVYNLDQIAVAEIGELIEAAIAERVQALSTG